MQTCCIFSVPDDWTILTKSVASNCNQCIGLKIRRVIHWIIQIHQFKSGDKWARNSSTIPRQANTKCLWMCRHYNLIVGRQTLWIILGGVNCAPSGTINYLIKYWRFLTTVKFAIIVCGTDQVLVSFDNWYRVTIFPGWRVREIPHGW